MHCGVAVTKLCTGLPLTGGSIVRKRMHKGFAVTMPWAELLLNGSSTVRTRMPGACGVLSAVTESAFDWRWLALGARLTGGLAVAAVL